MLYNLSLDVVTTWSCDLIEVKWEKTDTKNAFNIELNILKYKGQQKF